MDKSLFQYLTNTIDDCYNRGEQPSRVLEAMYILSEYMFVSDSGTILEDGDLVWNVYHDQINIINGKTDELLYVISFKQICDIALS
jgi:hypothetical protein